MHIDDVRDSAMYRWKISNLRPLRWEVVRAEGKEKVSFWQHLTTLDRLQWLRKLRIDGGKPNVRRNSSESI